jgi:hypothetical protein
VTETSVGVRHKQTSPTTIRCGASMSENLHSVTVRDDKVTCPACRAAGADPELSAEQSRVHGTASGLARHHRDETELCEPCTAFFAELVAAGLVRSVDQDRLPVIDAAPAPVFVGAGYPVDPKMLELHGALMVSRHTVRCGPDWVRTEIPCCAGDGTQRGRGIELPVDLDTVRLAQQYGLPTSPDVAPDLVLAVCPRCSLAWSVGLVDEGDGGYAANFLLVGPVVVASSRRTHRGV